MVRRLRLASGLVLFAYVATHLINHALGLFSYQTMEEGRVWFLLLWRNLAGTVALYGALLTHFLLALWAIYDRRRLDYSIGEAIQLALGISIPLLLAVHVVGTRLAHELGNVNDLYAYVLLVQFKLAPKYFYIQTAALFAAWIHGSIGLYYWLRLKPWFPSVSQLLFAAALLVPVLSFLGYVEGGEEVVELFKNPAWRRSILAAIRPPDAKLSAELYLYASWVQWTVIGGCLAALLGRLVRQAILRRRGVIRITYPNRRTVVALPGLTLLDISRANGIPHASVCGGRGRCSTCRVRIVEGADTLPAPAPDEQRVLERIGAPPHVRLACQTRPTRNLSIIPLLPPTASARDGRARPVYLSGEEREIVILFADLRDFTRFSERKLPYDVVFVLNRYFTSMGSSIRDAGGYLDKFIGDGVMALFGVENAAGAARRALVAARTMSKRLEELNEALASELDEPLRIGIGIHVGPVIIGEMGYAEATSLTAIGDSVNTASRLEAMTKEYNAQLVLSAAVAEQAGVDLSAFPSHEVEVRGRSARIVARVVANAMDLPVAEPAY